MVTHRPPKQKEFPGLELGQYFGASKMGPHRNLYTRLSPPGPRGWGQASQSRASSAAGLGYSPPIPPQRGSGQPTCILPDGESPGLLLDFLPRRVRNRSLTNLASSSRARFFFLSSSEMLMSGSWSFTRSMICPAGSVEGG